MKKGLIQRQPGRRVPNDTHIILITNKQMTGVATTKTVKAMSMPIAMRMRMVMTMTIILIMMTLVMWEL